MASPGSSAPTGPGALGGGMQLGGGMGGGVVRAGVGPMGAMQAPPSMAGPPPPVASNGPSQISNPGAPSPVGSNFGAGPPPPMGAGGPAHVGGPLPPGGMRPSPQAFGSAPAQPQPSGAAGPPPPTAAAAALGANAPPAGATTGAVQQPYPAPAPAQARPSAAAQSRIDPSQIPHPRSAEAQQASLEPEVFETRIDGAPNHPPTSTSNFIAVDRGNCSPRYMRLTLGTVPCSGDLAKNCRMPFALAVQPLALPHPEEELLQVVDFGPQGPIRCGRCKAYLNPFMKFVDGGRRFTCNFCSYINETPQEYFSPLGLDGRRTDLDQRPELCKGSIEIVAPEAYMIRPPMPVVHFFLIDVSALAVSSGVTSAACAAVAGVLGDLQGSGSARVGVATFDKSIHFYQIRKGAQPRMLVSPDVEEPYAALSANSLVRVDECQEELEKLLESIPGMASNVAAGESCAVAAIASATKVLEETGGKLSVFLSSLARRGFAALEVRQEVQGTVGPDKEPQKNLLPLETKKMEALAEAAAEAQTCVDIFAMPRSHVELATLRVFCEITGGTLYHYPDFEAAQDEALMFNDLRWNIVRPQGMEALMRVRSSAGISMDGYDGACHMRTPTDIDLAAVDCDKTYLVKLGHDAKLEPGQEVAFQCALLYTTTAGDRRIRLHTMAVKASASMSTMFRTADLDTQLLIAAREGARNLTNGKSTFSTRESVLASCVSSLAVYREFCASSSSTGQLILPEALKLLPLYILALNKSKALNTGASLDSRSSWCSRLGSTNSASFIASIYPRLFPIHELGSRPVQQRGKLPKPMPLSYEKLVVDGVYLMEDGVEAYIWSAKQARPELLQRLLGVAPEQLVSKDAPPLRLGRTDTEENQELHALLDAIRRERSTFLRLRILRHGDRLETLFFNRLVEDRSQVGVSYVEFLCQVHRDIQNRMA